MSVICDVCGMPFNQSSGYALTTSEVTTEPKYWEFIFNHHNYNEDLLKISVRQQAMQYTGWLVCESCSQMFTFNKSISKQYNQRIESLPGRGAVDINYVVAAAAIAWKNRNGTLPSWVI